MNNVAYKDIYETLKRDILSGKHDVRHALPSVGALVKKFGVARATIHHALEELAHQGLISRKQGRGTFVTSSATSRKIGLIMPDVVQSEYFVRIFRELMRISECCQYELLFSEIRGETAKERASCAEQLVDDIISRHVAGVIFQPIEYYADGEDFNHRMLARLDNAKIPVVLCDGSFDAVEQKYDVVGNNNIASSFVMYQHLVEAGAKKICFFMRPYSPHTHIKRAQGFALAHMPKLTGAVDRDSILVAEPDDAAAIRRRIRSKKIDAFMCGDDETAAKLMQTLHKLGYSIPDDILVSGFNDLRVSQLLSPTLTTLRTNCESIADAAFERLIRRIGNPSLPPIETFLPVELVVRESTSLRSHLRKREIKRL